MKNFSTKTDLLPHQVDAANKLLPPRVGGLFADMGTGKTRMVLELIYRRQRKIDKVVYFCPVSLKQTVWRELVKHTDVGSSDIYIFDDKTDERSLREAPWYIVGIESMSSSSRVVCAVNKIITQSTYVVLDESSYIKGHQALRTQRLTHLCRETRYRAILTGTPISQGVVDLYAQMKFLSPKILGYNSFYSFAANHLEYSDKFPGRIVKSHNLKYIAAKIKPYVYQVTKEECLDLPDKLYSTRYFDLSQEQRDWYQRIKDEALDLLDSYDEYSDYLTSIAIFRMFTALQQVTSGFVSWRGYHKEISNPRADRLVDVVCSLPDNERVLIFGKFQHDIEQIREALSERFGEESVSWFDGRKTEKQREEAVEQFKKCARFLVVTQSTGGHGFNFQELSRYTVFYNNGFKYAERMQSEGRIHRIGQEQRPTYISLYSDSGIDERIEHALYRKGNAVSEFRQEVEKVKKDKLKELIKAL